MGVYREKESKCNPSFIAVVVDDVIHSPAPRVMATQSPAIAARSASPSAGAQASAACIELINCFFRVWANSVVT